MLSELAYIAFLILSTVAMSLLAGLSFVSFVGLPTWAGFVVGPAALIVCVVLAVRAGDRK